MRTSKSFVPLGNNFSMVKIKKIWFDSSWMYGQDVCGVIYKQSILWYKRLVDATEEQRKCYELSDIGVHWRNINEDISFESFVERNDIEPNAMQKFFLSHRELNLIGFAKILGINHTLLYDYINGWKTPSPKRLEQIRDGVKQYARELEKVNF